MGHASSRLIAGRFEKLRILGEGGMGVVYEARHVFTGRPAAVKVMRPGALWESSEPAARFLREARAPGRIGHPAIVPVVDAGIDDDGAPYLAFELLHGMDLARAVADGPLRASEVVEIGLCVLDVLEAAHHCGFVHRDVKPANIFLARGERGDTEVRLLDFGIARALHAEDSCDATQTGAVLGTPRYMSPEQLRGEKADPRADVWGVGASMYHALVGRPPFGGDNYNVLVSQVLLGAPLRLADARPDLPRGLCAIVDRALGRDREARWASAHEMASALRKVDLTPRPAVRRWPLVSGITGVTLMVASVLIAAFGAHPPASRSPAAEEPSVAAAPLRVEAPEDGISGDALELSQPESPQPTAFRDLLNEGRRFSREGDHRAAIRAYRRALDLQPDDLVVSCELGWSAVHDGRPGLAAEHLDRAIARLERGAMRDDPTRNRLFAACLYNRGLAYEEQGQSRQAVQTYQRVMALRPNRTVRERLASLEAAEETPNGV